MASIIPMADVLGWAAATLTLLTFNCTNMQRLRLLALGANGTFVAYAWMSGLSPVLALHVTLIPINAYRLMQCRERLCAEAVEALAAPGQSGLLSAARPVQRLVMESRRARPQRGGCTSLLRRHPAHAGKGVAVWRVHADCGSGSADNRRAGRDFRPQPCRANLSTEPAAAAAPGQPSSKAMSTAQAPRQRRR